MQKLGQRKITKSMCCLHDPEQRLHFLLAILGFPPLAKPIIYPSFGAYSINYQLLTYFKNGERIDF
jgi:hypothetical protein